MKKSTQWVLAAIVVLVAIEAAKKKALNDPTLFGR